MKGYIEIYRIAFLFTAFVLNFADINAQHVSKISILGDGISYRIDSGYYDINISVGVPGGIVKSFILSKRTNRIVEELIKTSDTSICYFGYDGKFNIISKGVFNSGENKFTDTTTTIFDNANDPTGEKGLMEDFRCERCLLRLQKEGFWVEGNDYKNDQLAGVGSYKDGKRSGDWEFGSVYQQHLGDEKVIINTKIIKKYNDGILGESEKLKSLPNNETLAFSGIWYVIDNYGDSIISLSRTPQKMLKSDFIDFYTTYSCKFSYGYFNGPKYQSHIGVARWAINGGVLSIIDSSSQVKFTVGSLTKYDCVIKKNRGVERFL